MKPRRRGDRDWTNSIAWPSGTSRVGQLDSGRWKPCAAVLPAGAVASRSQVVPDRDLYAIGIAIAAVDRVIRAVQVFDTHPGAIGELIDQVRGDVLQTLGARRRRSGGDVAVDP